jgi:hypothetical protein
LLKAARATCMVLGASFSAAAATYIRSNVGFTVLLATQGYSILCSHVGPEDPSNDPIENRRECPREQPPDRVAACKPCSAGPFWLWL